MRKTALQILFSYGHEPYLKNPKAKLLHRPFQFVKSKKSCRQEAWKILGSHEVHSYPQEGHRTIFAVGPIDEKDLPRVIWLKLESGLWAGWPRNRKIKRDYDLYRTWQKSTPGAPVIQGKTA